jgi:hypothetical protein
MKKILLITSMLCTFNLFAQINRIELGFNSNTAIPNKHIMPNMNTAWGMGFSMGYRISKALPLSLTYNGNFSWYGMKTLEQTFIFNDSSSTNTNVDYTSGFHRHLIGAKYTVGKENSKLMAYAMPQFGLGITNSRIVVHDPASADDCKVLQNKTTQRFVGAVYGFEAGVQYGIGTSGSYRAFNKHVEKDFNSTYITASVAYLGSVSSFKYSNVNYMMDNGHNHGSTTTNADQREAISTEFVNLSSNQIHQHKIGELYQTRIQMWQINVGILFKY